MGNTKEYATVRLIKDKLRAEEERIKDLKKIQRAVAQWIRKSKLSRVEVVFPEPGSSGYRHTIVDIHSPTEAYIFWSDGGYYYRLLASIFSDDFGNLSKYDESEVRYTCEGLLKLQPTSRKITEIKKDTKTGIQLCCHPRLKDPLCNIG